MIKKSTRAEYELVDEGIVGYKLSKVPFTSKPSFVNIYRAIKNPKGEVLAGIHKVLYCWKFLNIDVLSVKEECRSEGYGSAFIDWNLIHLDTFDFQT